MFIFIIKILLFEILISLKKNKPNNFVLFFFLFFILYDFSYQSNYFIFRFFDIFVMYYFRFFFLKVYHNYIMINSYILSQLKFDLKKKIKIKVNSSSSMFMLILKILAFFYSFPLFFFLLVFDSLKRMNFLPDYDFAIKGYHFVFGDSFYERYPIYLTPKGFIKILKYKELLVDLKYVTLPNLEYGSDFFFRDEWLNLEEEQ